MNIEASENPLIVKDAGGLRSVPVIKRQRRLHVEKGGSDFDTLHYFYFILSGKIRISQINFETSKEQTLYLLGPGDMFDVATLLDGKENEYLIEALEESEVVEVPIEDVRTLLASEPSFQKFFFPYMAKQLRGVEALAIDLSLYDIYDRLVHLFVRYLDRSDPTNPKFKLIDNLSHEEIASMVGSVRKVVNRALQKLKKEGIVDISRKKLKLQSLQKLLDKIEY